jgi:hypothetical protein
VRYYGLYAHASRRQLDQARALHAQQPVKPSAPLDWKHYLARFALRTDPTRCPTCHAPLVRAALISRSCPAVANPAPP